MLFKLLKFEWSYHSKRISLYIFLIFFTFLGFLNSWQGAGATNIHLNSPYWINYYSGFFSLVSVLAIMFFSVNAMLRDVSSQFEGILFSTGVSKRNYFISRFNGILLVGSITTFLYLVGFAMGAHIPKHDPTRLGDFQITHYLWTWLIFILPNVFIVTSMLFSIVSITKNAVATYVGGIFIYSLYWICAFYFNSPLLASNAGAGLDQLTTIAIADPVGLSAFFEQTQFWTPFEKNIRLLSLSGNLLWNRIVWLLISLVVLITTYKIFSFRTINQKVKKIDSEENEIKDIINYRPIIVHFNTFKSQLLTLKSLVKLEFKNLYKSLSFIAVMLLWVFIIFMEIFDRINGGGEYGVDLYPTTDLIIWLIIDPLPKLGLLLVIFYSGEIKWRAHSVHFNQILGATPVRNAIFYLSQYIVLIALPMLMITLSILLGIGLQISKGYYEFEIGQYLFIYYYYGVPLIFYVSLALFMQSLVKNKFIGMILIALVLAFFGPLLGSKIGLSHPLFHVLNMPELEYSNLTGYGHHITSFNWFVLYWFFFVAIISFLAFNFWQRGTLKSLKEQFLSLIIRVSRAEKLVLGILTVFFILTGSFIYFNYNILNEFSSYNERLDFSEEYEKKYKKFENLKRPTRISMKTTVDIFPESRSYKVKANYELENKSDTLMIEIFVTERLPLQKIKIESAQLISSDKHFGTYLFKFNNPLKPGEKVKMNFELVKKHDGFSRENKFSDKAIVNNGSYILHDFFEPILGYKRSNEISDNYERLKRGLPEIKKENLDDSHLLNSDNTIGIDKVIYETIVSTTKGQTAIAPGNLQKKWEEDNRKYFHYKTINKVVPLLGYFSAKYEVEKVVYNDIQIELYYHKGHGYNIDKMIEVTKATLDYCIKNYGAYQHDHLRIAEIPGFWPFGGQAMPGTISMTERSMYLLDIRNPQEIDVVARRTIHEVAHQWWGHQLVPKSIEGGSVMVESFAKYTESAVIEKLYGKEMVKQLSDYESQSYFRGRSYARSEEPALYLSAGQSYISYRKGFVVLNAIKELIGENTLNKAIKSLNQNFKEKSFQATSLDFMNEIESSCNNSIKMNQVENWMKTVQTYDLKIVNAQAIKLPEGGYQIEASLETKKFETDSKGVENAIDFKEEIQLAIFNSDPSIELSNGAPFYIKFHQLTDKLNEIIIKVDELPKYIAIDPYYTRLDKNRVDNYMEIDIIKEN